MRQVIGFRDVPMGKIEGNLQKKKTLIVKLPPNRTFIFLNESNETYYFGDLSFSDSMRF